MDHAILDRYVGVPWVLHGRDITGADCWGLVRMVLAECAGIDVPSFDTVGVGEACAAAAAEETRTGWVRVTEPRMFDVALMKVPIGRLVVPGHVGIFVSTSDVLCARDETGSVILPLRRVAGKIEAVYRHEVLA